MDNSSTSLPWIDRVFENEDPSVQQAITIFADFGRRTRIFAVVAKEWWTRHALGDSVADNAFAIALGYYVFAILLAVYLNVLTLGSMRNAGRAVRQTVHNQLLVLKVRVVCQISIPAKLTHGTVRWPCSCLSRSSSFRWLAEHCCVFAPPGRSPPVTQAYSHLRNLHPLPRPFGVGLWADIMCE
jgi:hypothetical protein